MTTLNDIKQEVTQIFATRWQLRDGIVVPDSSTVKLGNDAVNLDATVLYADLAESTELVDQFKAPFAAEIYKAYLVSACKVIRLFDGEITAFDGDRVMAVFLGKSKNSNAAKAALKINWVVQNVINAAIKTQYPQTTYQVKQAVGIDSSPLFVAKTGVRGSNDLVWVGRAANYAAKLCSIREANYRSFITENVHSQLAEESKIGGNPRRPMWDKLMWNEMGVSIYASHWTWGL